MKYHDSIDILTKIDNPRELEKLYQQNKAVFRKEFNTIYPNISDNKIAGFWHERLNYETNELSWGSGKELMFVIIASLFAGLIAKLPEIMGFKEEDFYMRNVGFIVFPLLTIYFWWKNNISVKNLLIASLAIIACVIYINLLPGNNKNDTLVLACIHLPLFLWAILGFVFTGNNVFSHQKRLDFLRYNGDLVVMTTLLLIAGGLLTGLTIGLFELIGFKIGEFYFKYVAIFGLSAAPLVGTYVTQTNPQLVNKVSPVIAKIFSPLVLVTLVIYLIAIVFSGKDPYNDRQFLLIFNALLIGVMAIILFSVAETSRSEKNKTSAIILFLLSAVTVIVNGIALSAILFRIKEFGITPNRLAVLGGNVLILTNLLLVTYKLFKSLKRPNEVELVEKSIASFLPVYALWTVVVVYIFPLIFGFR